MNSLKSPQFAQLTLYLKLMTNEPEVDLTNEPEVDLTNEPEVDLTNEPDPEKSCY